MAAPPDRAEPPLSNFSSSTDRVSAANNAAVCSSASAPAPIAGIGPVPAPQKPRDTHHIGIAGRIGASGGGFDVAVPLSRQFALRAGGDFIRYTGTFQQDAATIDATLQSGYGKLEADWFPRGRWFHISPLLIVANNTRVQATVTIDPGQQLDFGGEQFRGSTTDPLHGTGRVDLRHTAPGLSIGTGNLTRGHGHLVFPAEFGFFYVGQPKLAVDFTGSVCDISHPEVGCSKVQDDPDFQKQLAAFIRRNNHTLSYAQFLPILNFGVGYRF